jgi:L-asparaginase
MRRTDGGREIDEPAKPNVTILSTGGTIASTGGDDGAQPEKGGKELLGSAAEAYEYASITVEEVAQIPSFDMNFETMATITRRAQDAIESGEDGVVVTHGTDTMEESAFYAARTLGSRAPITFTGAQRRPDESSSDGPANLIGAVRAVTSEPITSAGGSYIVFNDQVHEARKATKCHTSRLDTFKSPNGGPIATITREGIRFHHDPMPDESGYQPVSPDVTVRIVPSSASAGRGPIDDALDSGVDGLVIEGTGLGNTTAEIGDAVGEAIAEGVPVVVSSRCIAGTTMPVYGGRGGGETLRKHGVGFAGELSTQKARIELALALATQEDPMSSFDVM